MARTPRSGVADPHHVVAGESTAAGKGVGRQEFPSAWVWMGHPCHDPDRNGIDELLGRGGFHGDAFQGSPPLVISQNQADEGFENPSNADTEGRIVKHRRVERTLSTGPRRAAESALSKV